MVMPIGDDNTGRATTPYVVYGLIAVNVLVYLLQMTAGDSFTNGWAMVPYEITHNTDLTNAITVRAGDQTATLQNYPGPVPIYLTLLSSMFMHGSLLHIGGNMLYLWIFGDQIEDLLGHVKFLVFYLLCGFAADAAHIFSSADSMIPTLGASGAIAGVLGAYLVKYPRNPIRVLLMRMVTQMPAIVVLGLWFVLQFISQMTMGPGEAGVAYWAHIGGFVAGMALVFVFGMGGRKATVDPIGRLGR
jgi:membrane associated rhomboid family serine protease